VVMTTEITFRNMLNAEVISEEDRRPPRRLWGGVLDECHYMNDSSAATQSGKKSSSCPPAVQLVALSPRGQRRPSSTAGSNGCMAHTTGDEVITAAAAPGPSASAVPRGCSLLKTTRRRALHPNCGVAPLQTGERRKGKKFETTPAGAAPLPLRGGQMAERDMLRHLFHTSVPRRRLRPRRCATRRICLVSEAEPGGDRPPLDPSWRPRLRRWREGGHADALRRGLPSHQRRGACGLEGTESRNSSSRGLVQGGVCHRKPWRPASTCPRATHGDLGPLRTNRAGPRPLMGSEFPAEAPGPGRRGLDGAGYVVTVQEPFRRVRESRNAWHQPGLIRS